MQCLMDKRNDGEQEDRQSNIQFLMEYNHNSLIWLFSVKTNIKFLIYF